MGGTERERVELSEVRVESPEDAVELGWAEYFPLSKIAPYAAWQEFHDPDLLSQHVKRLVALVKAEGPAHEKYVVGRLTRAFGLQRAGNRIWEATMTALTFAVNVNGLRRRGPFVWPPAGELERVRVPSPYADDSLRPIEHIPPEELELALLRMTETAESIDPGILRVNVSRIFGFERTGDKIDQALEVRLTGLLSGRRLALAGGLLSLGPKASLMPIATLRHLVPDDSFPPGTWVKHPHLGVGRVVEWTGSMVSVDFHGEVKRLESKATTLTKWSKPW